jgi:hypothetical protein
MTECFDASMDRVARTGDLIYLPSTNRNIGSRAPAGFLRYIAELIGLRHACVKSTARPKFEHDIDLKRLGAAPPLLSLYIQHFHYSARRWTLSASNNGDYDRNLKFPSTDIGVDLPNDVL